MTKSPEPIVMPELTYEQLTELKKLSNVPSVIKYIDKEMPIIISICYECNVELFRSMTYETITQNIKYCSECDAKRNERYFKLFDFVEKLCCLPVEHEELRLAKHEFSTANFVTGRNAAIASIALDARDLLKEIGEL